MRIDVFCTLTFEAWHRWPDAPDEFAYLRDLHRHMFHVRLAISTKTDRQIEFIDLKRQVGNAITKLQQTEKDVKTWSCERWAMRLLGLFDAAYVQVSEDGENGAVVYS